MTDVSHWLDAALVSAATALAVSVAFMLVEGGGRRAPSVVVGVLVAACGLAVATIVTGDAHASVGVTGAACLLYAVLVSRLRGFHASGVLLLVSYLLLAPALLLWGTYFVWTVDINPLTRLLLLAPLPLAVVLLPPTMVRTFENCEPLIRRRWERPRVPVPVPVATSANLPRVSIHVPTHAEPPEVVIATLDSLARLDYANFEVLVIDNNTVDPALWIPVAQHCERLGPRFRFLHVEGLAGAKAGALNLALDNTEESVDLVAVIDADYQIRPEFLSETVRFFDDPRMGFVQTPHAYRDADNPYLAFCDREYANFFATGMVSRNQRNAGITVGTMCVIRREALERAGRWATWCMTEDSELAVRIHAVGYDSVYLTKIYGRGLIPDTFAGYRKQRYRWTYGPVSELFAHWRLHTPGPGRRQSRLTIAQRLHHATHGLYGITTGVAFLMLPYGLVVAAVMLAQGDELPVPVPLWLTATVMLISGTALRWLVYRRLLGARVSDWLGASLASAALAHVVIVGNLTAMLRRPVRWERTNKFPSRSSIRGALRSVSTETVLGMTFLALAVGLVTLPRPMGFLTLMAVGLSLRGVQYFAAPLLALLAVYHLHAQVAAPDMPHTASRPLLQAAPPR